MSSLGTNSLLMYASRAAASSGSQQNSVMLGAAGSGGGAVLVPVSEISSSTTASAATNNQVLHYGDVLSLVYEDEKSHISVRGLNPIRCGCVNFQESYKAPLKESLFMVMKGGSYSALKRYNEFMEMKTVTTTGIHEIIASSRRSSARFGRNVAAMVNTNAEKSLESKRLKTKMQREEQQNKIEAQRELGKVVTYGARIQLLHLETQEYLTVLRTNAELEKACIGLSLASSGSRTFFQILPHFKFRAENEPVRLSDKIILFNEKSKHTLHCSQLVYNKPVVNRDNRNEVNATASNSSNVWRINLFSPYSAHLSKTLLKIGDVIRLFHKDAEGYIFQHHEHIKLFTDKSALSSICSLFEIENSDRFRGGFARYSVPFRLKHLPTGCYLTVQKTDVIDQKSSDTLNASDNGSVTSRGVGGWLKIKKGLKQVLRPSLTKEPTDDTLFTFHSPEVGASDAVGYGQPIERRNLVRIRHVKTDTWLHASERSTKDIITSRSGSMFRSDSKSSSRRASMSPTLAMLKDSSFFVDLSFEYRKKETDVFSVSMSSEKELKDFYVVNQVFRIIGNFRKMLKKSSTQQPQRSDIESVLEMLRFVIRFCTESGEQDVMKREGIPYPDRQSAFRDIGLIDIIMNIIQESMNIFGKEDKWDQLYQYSFRSIRQITLLHVSNSLYVFEKYFHELQNHILGESSSVVLHPAKDFSTTIGHTNTQLLIGMIKDNMELLNSITQKQIEGFFKLLVESDQRNPLYLDLLNILCKCEERPIQKNQNDLVSLLKNALEKNPNLFIIPSIEKDDPVVKIPSTGESKSLKSFSETEHFIFMLTSIRFFASLCSGKNSLAIPFIQQLFPYELVLKCIQDTKAPLSIRSAFANLMEYLYVDAIGIEEQPAIKLTRKWLATGAHIKSTSFEEYRARHKKLKDFIHGHFFVAGNRKLSPQSDQSFNYQLIKICYKLFLYRAYNPYGDDLEQKKLESYQDQEEISGIVNSLLKMLNSNNVGEEHFIESESNRTIIKIKNKISDIILYVLDMRIDVRISLYLDVYSAKEKDVDNTSNLDTILSRVEEKSKKIPFFQFDSEEHNFIPAMLSLLQYKNNETPIKALKMLLRSHMQEIELKNNLERLVLLTSPKLVQSYETIFNYYNKLNNLVNNATFSGSKHDSKEYKEFKSTVNGIVSDAKKYGPSAQSILRNLQIHELMITCLTKTYPENIKFNIFQKAVLVLTEFVRGNPENQVELFPHMQFFINIFSDKLDTSELLCEIVRDNRDLLMNIDEKLIHKYIDKVGDLGKLSWHLNFLRVLTRIGTSNIQRNQDIIAIYLSTERKDIIVLFNDDAGIEERKQRIENKEYKISGSLLNYHINMLYLLCDCTLGTVKEAEVKIQSILSFEDCLSLLISENLIPLVRDPLMSLMNELYINTEKKSNDVLTNASIWRLFKRISQEIKYYVSCKGRNTCKLERDITYQLPPLKNDLPQDDDDIETEFYVSEKYIYSIVVPLLKNYFANYFSKESASKDSAENISEIISDIITQLIELYTFTANPKYREDISDCILEIRSRAALPISIETKFKELKKNRAITVLSPNSVLNPALTINAGNEDAKRFKAFIETLHFQSSEAIFSKLAKSFVEQYGGHFKCLIEVLQRIMTIGISKDLVETFVGAVETIKYAIKGQKPEFVVDTGIPELVLQLLTAEYDIVSHALKLSHEMLNSVETRKVVNTIVSSGSYESFFVAIRNRLRQSTYEVKEHFSLRKRSTTSSMFSSRKDNSQAKDVLLFLKLLCEGHFLPNQQMLYNQPFNSVPVNLVSECVDYVISLFKYLSNDSVDNFIQAFDTLNEMIQGPCIETSIELASSTRFLAVINEILARKVLDPEDGDIMEVPDDNIIQIDDVDYHLDVLDHELELLEKIIILLTSMLEGGNKISKNYIKKTIDFKALCKLMVIFRKGNVAFKTKLTRILTIEKKPELLKEALRKAHNIGISIFILLKYLDFDFSIISSEYLDSNEKSVDQVDETGKVWLKYYNTKVGTIEVVRDNVLEKVHFKVLKRCRHLQETTKDEFVEACDRSSPQTKVKSLFDWTYQIARVEMAHLKNLMDNPNSFNARGWKLTEKYWYHIRLGVFLLAVVINILVLATYTKQFDVISGPVIVPGVPLTTQSPLYRNNYNYLAIGIIVETLGLILLGLNIGLSAIYLYFFLTLNIKKKFKLKKDENWNDITKTNRFIYNFLLYALQDPYIWRIILFFWVIVIGIFVTPLAYIVLTFEIIALSPDGLLDIILAIGQNYEKLLYTAVLTLFSVLLHTFLMFSFKYDQFKFNNTIVCTETLTCFMSILNYGLRGGGFWEDITDAYPLDVPRIFIDLYFSLLIIILLVNVVFGIVLDSFSERREEKAELEQEKTGCCFICSHKKSRFDVRANEGISFEGHIKHEHNMWNYVFYLIYLENKDPSEYTGIEQYVAELANKQYITFFPTLRSMTLERAESDETVEQKENATLKDQAFKIESLQHALQHHKRFSSYMSKDDEIVNSLMDSKNSRSASNGVPGSHHRAHMDDYSNLDYL
ncbi:hypothetical protein C9374_011527 [Naegleria lovaniensis]|uniref:MIR domain-containing protein n=1 Tax=Naegleria lovaniensis TaxID=51637 RepID=A0AA88H4K2_NAELO|nr:uncharacterized protein C9374_011527 [Naegleria lovaniensis]KAG2392802.1 hypothetical protein C9374_011527 [Naegleria lovaniensis]